MKLLCLFVALVFAGCHQQENGLVGESAHIKYSLSQNSHIDKNHEGHLVLKSGGGRFIISKSSSDNKLHAPDITLSISHADFEIHIDEKWIKIIVHAGFVEISSPYVMSFVPEIVKINESIQFDRINKVFLR